MADLDFKHKVSEIPRGEQLPISKGPTVKAEIGHTPDFQNAVSTYADNSNWMSSLGSAVATRSSTAIATKIGGELGKNPQGDLGPSITNFDKVMAESYAEQAHSTLGIQAQTLISKNNLELAKQPRIDANMIAATQKSTLQGLEKIFSMAPSSIRPRMEAQFGGIMIHQNEQLVTRMIGDQKTDRVNNLELSNKVNAENAYALALSGNDKAAEAAVSSSTHSNHASAARYDISPERAKVAEDTIRQSAISGRVTRHMLEAEKNGKLNEELASLADNPDKFNIGVNDQDAVIKNVMYRVNRDQQLRSLDERHTALEMHNRILETGGDISGSEWAAFKESVSPNVEAQMRINLTTAQQRNAKKRNDTAQAIKNVTDFDNFNQNSPEQSYDAFVELTTKAIDKARSNGKELSVPEASMQIAATLAGPIPKFNATLNTKAASGDPRLIQEVQATVQYMQTKNASQNLAGITDDTYSLLAKYDSLSAVVDPIERGQIAKDQIYNKKSEQNIANDQAWKNFVKVKKSKGMTDAAFALSQADIESDSVVNIPLISQYALDKYETLFKLNNGDVQTSQKLLKEDIARTFGTTHVNGNKEYTMFPIETRGNLPLNSVPFIHEDIRNQVSTKLTDTKKLYNENKVDFYWEMNPGIDLDTALASNRRIRELQPHYGSYKLKNTENPKHEVYLQQRELLSAKENINSFLSGKSPKITQHFRDGHKKEYEIIVQPNQSLGVNSSKGIVGFYNVMLKAGNSTTPLLLADPSQGPPIYKPKYESIKKNYALLQYYLPPDLELPPETKRIVENLQREYINPKI